MSAAEPIDFEDVLRRSRDIFGPPDAEREEPVVVKPPWPTLDDAALHGLLGDVVRTIDPTTEADQVATAVTFLTMCGSCVGRGPHLMVGDDRHGTNLYMVLVGDTAIAEREHRSQGPVASWLMSTRSG